MSNAAVTHCGNGHVRPLYQRSLTGRLSRSSHCLACDHDRRCQQRLLEGRAVTADPWCLPIHDEARYASWAQFTASLGARIAEVRRTEGIDAGDPWLTFGTPILSPTDRVRAERRMA